MNLNWRSILSSAVLAAGVLLASNANAATSDACTGGGFRVTIPNGTNYLGNGGFRVRASALPSHAMIRIQGKYIDMTLDASNFAIYDYVLTGAANPHDMTRGVRTPIWTSKIPDFGTRTLNSGDLEMKFDGENLEIQRRGTAGKAKIQAKDCAAGGVFQMELEGTGATVVRHQLAPNAFYFTNPVTGKVNFGNGDLLIGKDSPQAATLVSLNGASGVSSWSVQSGGRMGQVLGEDAVELTLPSPSNSCTQNCQVQNQIHGSLTVLPGSLPGGESEED